MSKIKKEKMRSISPTVLGLFKDCEKRCRFYLEKEPADFFKEADYTRKGSGGHRVLELFGRACLEQWDGGIAETKKELIELFREGCFLERGFGEGSKEEKDTVEGIIENYLTEGWPTKEEDFGVREIVFLEKKFGYKNDFNFKGIYYKGIIDRIERLKNGNYRITDYKFSNNYFSNRELENNFQAIIYSLNVGLEGNDKYRRPEFEFFFLNPARRRRMKADWTEEGKMLFEELSIKFKEAYLDKEYDWKAKIGDKCNFCDYRSRCETFKRYTKMVRFASVGLPLDKIVENHYKIGKLQNFLKKKREDTKDAIVHYYEKGKIDVDSKWKLSLTETKRNYIKPSDFFKLTKDRKDIKDILNYCVTISVAKMKEAFEEEDEILEALLSKVEKKGKEGSYTIRLSLKEGEIAERRRKNVSD